MGRIVLVVSGLALAAAAPAADDKAAPQRVRCRVTGLFAPEREADLRDALTQVPGVTLVAVDFDAGEVTVEYVPATAFPGAKPDQIVPQFDGKLKSASGHTFGIKPVSAVPRDKLERVEIAVAGLDCKACALAAYEMVAKLDGVEQATASFKDGKVAARIDPAKADRGKLEAALKKGGVAVVPR